jgi:hypothetical protein
MFIPVLGAWRVATYFRLVGRSFVRWLSVAMLGQALLSPLGILIPLSFLWIGVDRPGIVLLWPVLGLAVLSLIAFRGQRALVFQLGRQHAADTSVGRIHWVTLAVAAWFWFNLGALIVGLNIRN